LEIIKIIPPVNEEILRNPELKKIAKAFIKKSKFSTTFAANY